MSFEVDCPRCGRRAFVWRLPGGLTTLCWCGYAEPHREVGKELAETALSQLRSMLSQDSKERRGEP